VSFTRSLFIQLFLDYELFLEKVHFWKIKIYFWKISILRIIKINDFLIIQEKVDKKVYLDDTISKDNYNYCHL
jgi:hypothetical protein